MMIKPMAQKSSNLPPLHRTATGRASVAALAAIVLVAALASPATAAEQSAPQEEVAPQFSLSSDVATATTSLNEAIEVEGDEVDIVRAVSSEVGVLEPVDGEYATVYGALLASDDPESRAAAVAGSDRVEVLLPVTDGVELQVFRDGVQIYSGEPKNTVVDTEVESGQTYLYESTLISTIPEERWAQLLTDDEFQAVRSGESSPPTQSTTWGIPVTVPLDETLSAATTAATTAAVASPSQTTFRYRAFIQDAYVSAPQIACTTPTGTYRFKGDNRTWSPSAGSHRVQATAYFNWTSSTMTTARSVGDTVRQVKNSSGVWVNETPKNAGTSGITLTNKAMSSTAGRLYMKIAVSNPFCNTAVTLPIYAELQIDVRRSGSYAIISGTRRPVPNHEAYLRRDAATAWTAILSRTNAGFGCLAVVNTCGYDSLVRSGSY